MGSMSPYIAAPWILWDMLLGFLWFPMVFIWFSYCFPCSHRVRIAGPRSHRGGADVVLEKDKPWILPWVFRDLSWIYHGFYRELYTRFKPHEWVFFRYTQIWSWFLWRIQMSLTAWNLRGLAMVAMMASSLGGGFSIATFAGGYIINPI